MILSESSQFRTQNSEMGHPKPKEPKSSCWSKRAISLPGSMVSACPLQGSPHRDRALFTRQAGPRSSRSHGSRIIPSHMKFDECALKIQISIHSAESYLYILHHSAESSMNILDVNLIVYVISTDWSGPADIVTPPILLVAPGPSWS